MDLEGARAQINELDRQMAELFVARMRAVEEIAAYKKANGLPVFDAAREEQLKLRNAAFVDDGILRPYYLRFLEHTMELSRDYQKAILDGAWEETK
ncbi:MAG: chorismate mutase [Clostridia bacterium]|nr:chorismate mutase [Clostridia bacterium]